MLTNKKSELFLRSTNFDNHVNRLIIVFLIKKKRGKSCRDRIRTCTRWLMGPMLYPVKLPCTPVLLPPLLQYIQTWRYSLFYLSNWPHC